MAAALDRLLLNAQALVSRRRSSYFNQTPDHLHVSLHSVDQLHETCFVHDDTLAEPLDAYTNRRTNTLNPGFKL